MKHAVVDRKLPSMRVVGRVILVFAIGVSVALHVAGLVLVGAGVAVAVSGPFVDPPFWVVHYGRSGQQFTRIVHRRDGVSLQRGTQIALVTERKIDAVHHEYVDLGNLWVDVSRVREVHMPDGRYKRDYLYVIVHWTALLVAGLALLVISLANPLAWPVLGRAYAVTRRSAVTSARAITRPLRVRTSRRGFEVLGVDDRR